MTVCKQGFHNVVMAYMLQFAENTIHVIFMKAMFSCLYLNLNDGFLPYSMPEVFDESGHSLTNIIIA